MKRNELQKSRRTYRRSVDAYGQLQRALKAIRRATVTVPQMQRSLNRLQEAEKALQKLGDAVAYVIETADELEEQKDRCESFRKQAEAAGVPLRYDWPAAKDDATSDTTPHSEDDDPEFWLGAGTE